MKLIILRGLTGSGKSTLLNLLEKQLNFKKVEIDEIKIKKYGDTTTCIPSVDFKEAGLIAQQILINGDNVVVEEAFLSREHIGYFIQGLENSNPLLIYIRTECTVETSIERKIGVLDAGIVRAQYRRQTEDIEGELIYNTDLLTPSDIISQIDKIINKRS